MRYEILVLIKHIVYLVHIYEIFHRTEERWACLTHIALKSEPKTNYSGIFHLILVYISSHTYTVGRCCRCKAYIWLGPTAKERANSTRHIYIQYWYSAIIYQVYITLAPGTGGAYVICSNENPRWTQKTMKQCITPCYTLIFWFRLLLCMFPRISSSSAIRVRRHIGIKYTE